ncbi:GPW/gp25 family protein [Variovorax sp. J22P240]|uniref:GPW/gp25 family protein n=1 Tax=Variovorax sp. J22P240 TaxID=3053514 RepID=UPI002575042B|nr:GPW/gp25 family protein [Variovorax sp. J22P240]MDM0001810.1 GPW/gp25 family protein [Variovorax sp. J22P240]
MDAARLYGQGMAFPPRVQPDGSIAWSRGEDNIRESMRIVLMTEPGERLRLPQFGAGLGRFLFEPNTVTTHTLIAERISDALASWEARIHVEAVDVAADRDDPQAAIAVITYRLVATQSQERVSLSVSVAGGGQAG